MLSPRELGAAALRFLQDLAAAADHAADGFVQAAGLIAQIGYSALRISRAVIIIFRTLLTGTRVITRLVIRIGVLAGEVARIFSSATLGRYRQECQQDISLAERDLRRREREEERAAAEEERALRRGAQARSSSSSLRRRRRRHGHRRSPSSSSSGSTYFSAE